MKSEFTSLELTHFVRELTFLQGAKIEQIYQEGKERLTVVVHSKEKYFIHIAIGGLFFLGLNKGDNPTQPPGFCTYLRKYLKNSRIQSIKQIGFERIIDIELATRDKKFHFIVEMIAPGNAMLCNEDYLILSPLISANYTGRVIRPRVPYEHPKKDVDFLTITQNEFENLLHSTDKDTLVTTLAIELGLGGLYATEICFRSKVDKNKKPNELTTDELEMTYAAIQVLRNAPTKPQLIKKGDEIKNIVPIKLEHIECEESKYSTYWETLAHLLTQKQKEEKHEEIEKSANTKSGKLELRIAKQEQIIKGLEIADKENQLIGEKIYENYTDFENLLSQVTTIHAKEGWIAVKEKFPKLKVNEKTGEITVEILH